jgi:hypothetical protein
LKLHLNRDPHQGANLASQPTLSRFENNLSRRELLRMDIALAQRVIERQRTRLKGRAKRITIDLDGTDDPTHAQQRGALWNGSYDGDRYLPLIGTLQFNSESEQYQFVNLLRPGNANARFRAIPILRTSSCTDPKRELGRDPRAAKRHLSDQTRQKGCQQPTQPPTDTPPNPPRYVGQTKPQARNENLATNAALTNNPR